MCSNRRFKNKSYCDIIPKPTHNKGWGLFSNQIISPDTFIIEYVGEVISMKTCISRINQSQKTKNHHLYHMNLDDDRAIDATQFGNIARFLNHSCDPNCHIERWDVNGDKRVGIFADTIIYPGDELTIDYQYDKKGVQQPCFCGTAKCTGIIGQGKKDLEDKIRVDDFTLGTVVNDVNHIDSFCYYCGEESGELIMCDSTICGISCPRSYHPSCLNMSKVPFGKYF